MAHPSPIKCSEIQLPQGFALENQEVKSLEVPVQDGDLQGETQTIPLTDEYLTNQIYTLAADSKEALDAILDRTCLSENGYKFSRTTGAIQLSDRDVLIGFIKGANAKNSVPLKVGDIPTPLEKYASPHQERLKELALVNEFLDEYPPAVIEEKALKDEDKYLYAKGKPLLMELSPEEAAILQAGFLLDDGEEGKNKRLAEIKSRDLDLWPIDDRDIHKVYAQSLLVEVNLPSKNGNKVYAFTSAVTNSQYDNIEKHLNRWFDPANYKKNIRELYGDKKPLPRVFMRGAYLITEVGKFSAAAANHKARGVQSFPIPESALGKTPGEIAAARVGIWVFMQSSPQVKPSTQSVVDYATITRLDMQRLDLKAAFTARTAKLDPDSEEFAAELEKAKAEAQARNFEEALGDYIMIPVQLPKELVAFLRWKMGDFSNTLFIRHDTEENTYYMRRPDFEAGRENVLSFLSLFKNLDFLHNLATRHDWKTMDEDVQAMENACNQSGIDAQLCNRVGGLHSALTTLEEKITAQSFIYEFKKGLATGESFVASAVLLPAKTMETIGKDAWSGGYGPYLLGFGMAGFLIVESFRHTIKGMPRGVVQDAKRLGSVMGQGLKRFWVPRPTSPVLSVVEAPVFVDGFVKSAGSEILKPNPSIVSREAPNSVGEWRNRFDDVVDDAAKTTTTAAKGVGKIRIPGSKWGGRFFGGIIGGYLFDAVINPGIASAGDGKEMEVVEAMERRAGGLTDLQWGFRQTLAIGNSTLEQLLKVNYDQEGNILSTESIWHTLDAKGQALGDGDFESAVVAALLIQDLNLSKMQLHFKVEEYRQRFKDKGTQTASYANVIGDENFRPEIDAAWQSHQDYLSHQKRIEQQTRREIQVDKLTMKI